MKAEQTSTPISRQRKLRPGLRVGEWTVLNMHVLLCYLDGRTKTVALCKCDCGNIRFVSPINLLNNGTHSCGCWKIKHKEGWGKTRTPEYNAWTAMIQRCYDQNCKAYKDYGARGIIVCDRWRHDYATFLADMGRRPSKNHSLHRVDNEQIYSPENCVWALPLVQNNARRNTIIINGMPLGLLAHKHDIPVEIVRGRLRKNWTIEKALSVPVTQKPKPFGVSLSILAQQNNMSRYTLRSRLLRGWSIRDALSRPIQKRQKP